MHYLAERNVTGIFFFNLPFVGPAKPFNLGIGAKLARHQAEHVGDTDLTSQEL